MTIPLTAKVALKAQSNDSTGLTEPLACKSEFRTETNDSAGLAVPLTAEVASETAGSTQSEKCLSTIGSIKNAKSDLENIAHKRSLNLPLAAYCKRAILQE